MQINKTKTIGLIIVVMSIVGVYFGCYYSRETGPIYEFNAERDTKAILKLFDDNWDLLIANEGSSPAFYLKYRTPNDNPAYFGKLKIKVLREHNELAGFAAYYMEKPKEGRLLFLAVDSKFRGKGYGSTLAEYAIQDMTALGAQKIGLWTRLSNVQAQSIYKRLGFKEAYYTPGGFIFFEYFV